MKRIFWIAAMVMLVVSVNAQKKSTLETIVKNGELRVGMSGNQPPYTMTSLGGIMIGYEVDLATLLADAMGVKLTLVQMPFGDLLPSLKEGKVDVVMSGMTITPDRNMDALFVGPYMVSGKTIMTLAANLEGLDESTEINQSAVSLVALQGSTSEDFVKNFLPEAQLTLAEDYNEAVNLVINGDVKAMVADVEICQVSILRFPGKNLVAIDQPLTIEPIGMALPANDFLLENMIRNYFSTLQMMGALDLLEVKWFENGDWLMQIK
jgi:polar amino acid transport system substrate-binding protein